MRAAHVRIASTTRNARRWRRVRGRLGLVALWAALAVWIAGASVVVPDAEPSRFAVVAPALIVVDHAPRDVPDSAVEPAVTESIDTEGALGEPSPEEDATLYIAGR